MEEEGGRMEGTSKGVVDRFWEEVFNQGSLDVADEIFASKFELRVPAADPDGEVRGPEGMKDLVRRIRSAFPDVRATVEAQMTTERGRVTTHFTVSATRGDTEERIEIEGTCVSRVSGGRIRESRSNWDSAGLMMQLGVVSGTAERWRWPPWR